MQPRGPLERFSPLADGGEGGYFVSDMRGSKSRRRKLLLLADCRQHPRIRGNAVSCDARTGEGNKRGRGDVMGFAGTEAELQPVSQLKVKESVSGRFEWTPSR